MLQQSGLFNSSPSTYSLSYRSDEPQPGFKQKDSLSEIFIFKHICNVGDDLESQQHLGDCVR